MKRYGEEKVDNMRKQKDEELELYKKEIERQKRFDLQKGSSTAHGSAEKVVLKRKMVASSENNNQAPP